MLKNWSPNYKVQISEKGLSSSFHKRLISISVQLYSGDQSDQLSLVFDAGASPTGKYLDLPGNHDEIAVWLGYKTKLQGVGRFRVNHWQLQGANSGNTLSVSATPKLFKNEASRTWGVNNLVAIGKKIAAKNQARCVAHASLSTISVEESQLNQVNESDISFLSRIAKRYDVFVKPTITNSGSDVLLMFLPGKAVSASGIPLVPAFVTAEDIINWNISITIRSTYKKVIAYWHDHEIGEQQKVEVISDPKSKDTLRLDYIYPNKADAKYAAQGMADRKERKDRELSLTVVGNPMLQPEMILMIQFVHPEINGKWFIKTVNHQVSHSGFISSVTAYQV
ncbi:hypothetical protein KCM76_16245 [Zooshikella marina]|uniref:phage late control D family protein n=1 Tax=Zooshikella ganghwensis TaxID=202772 RepID=UPI001BAF1953|nr:contractile injection system protein, VgrG/Pvc8 family [Zooshikella ganghwensis]MBU2707546.1 hypothetical protein [Zooshikella ganghwensis]